jgi:hypothetical protein
VSDDVDAGEAQAAPEKRAPQTRAPQTRAPQTRAARQDGIKILISNFWIWPAAAGVLLTTGVAWTLGFQDVVWPVSLSAQILGFFFLVAGLFGLISAWLMAARAMRSVKRRPLGRASLSLIAAGAVASFYVDATIVAYAFRYQPLVAIPFGVLGIICIGLAWRTLPAAWGSLSKTVKGAGITLAALGTLTNFWYQSIYLPENAQAGVEYSVSVGPVVSSGSDRFVTIDVTMDNESPVTALTLASMVVVSGLEYTSSTQVGATSKAEAQKRTKGYAASLAKRPGTSAAIPNPNVAISGQPTVTTLTILRPIENDSSLFPDDAYSREFDVVVPSRQIIALEVKLYVLFARTSRLSLGPSLYSATKRIDGCPNDDQSAWYINESALVRFTRGAQLLYSDWCADLGDPFITWSVGTPPGTHDSPGAEDSVASGIDVINSSRDDIFVLN